MPLTLRIVQVDVTSRDVGRVTSFWSEALSARPVNPGGVFTHLHHATSAIEVHVQQMRSGTPRYHLDLEADDRTTQVQRLLSLGARHLADHDDGYTVLTCPAGLELCVVDADAAPPTPVRAPLGGRGYLDAVFVDVPAGAHEAAVAFWSSALDAPVAGRDGAYTTLEPVRTTSGADVTIEVQSIAGRARHHIDLSAPSVEREVARLEQIGASRVGTHDDWVTLADPVGNLLCVVPRAAQQQVTEPKTGASAPDDIDDEETR